MKHGQFVYALSRNLGFVILAALLVVALPVASVPMSDLAAANAPVEASNGATVDVPSESWRLGVTSEGLAAYETIVGRPLGEVAAFRSDRGTADVYYIFPAPSTQRIVRAARFYILSRIGAYRGSAALTLEILDYAGTVQHAASAVDVELQAARAGAWSEVALSETPADLEIAPGEFLAFHFCLDGGPGGDLDVRPIFEVEVR